MIQKAHFGYGSISTLTSLLKDYAPHNIFLVTGRNSYETCGAKETLTKLLGTYPLTHFYDFATNPKIEDVKKGITLFKQKNCNLTLAVGGGSVLDIAKSINILAANGEDPLQYVENSDKMKEMEEGHPLIAVPTTSGTGSEATKFSVVYIGKKKYSLEHESMMPNHAIVDPQFTMNLPPYITACTGMDAFCQAIESYWSVNSTEESQQYAREAIQLVMGNLEKAVNAPSKNSRENMAKAAYLAGKAINISKTTACHALSYPLTSHFNVEHGQAVALTLGKILVYNYGVTPEDCNDGRGVDYVRKGIESIASLIGVEEIAQVEESISSFIESVGMKTTLKDLNADSEKAIDLILEGVNVQRLSNNPRNLTEEQVREILTQLR